LRPYLLDILDEIEARLGSMTSSNGYDFDLRKLVRGSKEPFISIDLPGINHWIEGGTTEVGPLDIISESYYLRCLEEDRDGISVDQSAILRMNILTALFRDVAFPLPSDPYSSNLGGMVEKFHVLKYDNIIGEGMSPIYGVDMQFLIEWKANKGDLSAPVFI